jgi:hypothetical protein
MGERRVQRHARQAAARDLFLIIGHEAVLPVGLAQDVLVSAPGAFLPDVRRDQARPFPNEFPRAEPELRALPVDGVRDRGVGIRQQAVDLHRAVGCG